jgi:hypothetical protein
MKFVTQDDAVNDDGIIISVGLVVAGERCAIVLPMVKASGDVDPDNAAAACVKAIGVGFVPDLCAFLSDQAYVSHVAGEGMINGGIPARLDYGSTDHPGQVDAEPLPQQVSILVTTYKTSSGSFGDRQKVGHQYLPGFPVSTLVGGALPAPTISNIEDLFQNLIEYGYDDVDTTTNWRRYFAVPDRSTSAAMPKIGAYACRGYVGTQKRRLLPHP